VRLRAAARGRRGAAAYLALLALAAGPCSTVGLAASPSLSWPSPPAERPSAPPPAPWRDADGADHLRRDAERRAREAPLAPAAMPSRGAAASPADAGSTPAASAPADADAWRRQGERERDARRLRGGLAPPPPVTPRIQPDAPASLAMPPPPRIAIPGPGEPGGPPIALPTCGAAGCFDANGRAWPAAGGGWPLSPGGEVLRSPGGEVLRSPGGVPCVRVGAAASC
jgi:hypothetical protein